MKKRIILGTAVLMAGCLTVSTIKSNAQSKDVAAIKKVIEEESNAYFHKNYDNWLKTWAHDPADVHLNIGPSGYGYLIGWSAIAAEYKKEMQQMGTMSEADIAPLVHKTDYDIKVNGNMASASFKNGKHHNAELRTLVKQNGQWEILSLTSINSAAYAMRTTINRMKTFTGKWVLDGKASMKPSNGVELNSLQFDLEVTPNGLEQLSDATFSNKGHSFAPPTEYEYFIPDYSTNTVSYMDIYKNPSGQTFTRIGQVTSNHPNSFTVTVMYSGKPTTIQDEYTVTMKNGERHEVGRHFNRDGKRTSTSTINLRRMK